MKVIEVVVRSDRQPRLKRIAAEHEVTDIWWGQPDSENDRVAARMLVAPAKRQEMLDTLQRELGDDEKTRIVVSPVEAALPRGSDDVEEASPTTTREELYIQVAKGARLDSNHLLLVLLSTVVAAIGLVEDNVAVIIGAMVIAPLLGPNLALALGTILGDRHLTWRALKANLAGIVLSLALAYLIPLLWPIDINSPELMARTDVNLAGVALAFASGAAAVLSLTTGVSSVLVGVMVAVALLPPAATIGIMLGAGQPTLASGAALLLAVNIVAVNLSAKLVFLLRGVRPRTWLEKRQAQQSTMLSVFFWLLSMALLIGAILLRQQLPG